MDSLQRLQTIARDQHIDGWRVRAYFWSRNPAILAAIVGVILAAAVVLGWHFRAKHDALLVPGAPRGTEGSLQTELAKDVPQLAAVLAAMHHGDFDFSESEPTDVPETIRASRLIEPMKTVALAAWESLGFGEPTADLLYAAHWTQPLPLANETVGDLYTDEGRPEKARDYFEREVRATGADSARKKHVALLLAAEDFPALATLASDAAYRPHVPPEAGLRLAARERRWGEVAAALTALERELYQPMPMALAAVAGLAWMLIALQAIQPPRLVSFRMLAPWLAVVAGMASTWPTLFAGLWQEQSMGLRHSGEFVGDFLFFVAGVGPREELIKLACFLPFVPFLLRRGSRLEMLMSAGCVGLGFAVQENLQYFHQHGAAIAFGRFLTANFFHLAATGLTGLALCDALREPRKKALPFLGTLVSVSLIHGFYDAFMAVPGLQLLPIVSMIAFGLLALTFFRKLRTLRDGMTDQISIAATLVLGLSTLTGTMFVCAASQLGFLPAAVTLATSSAGLVMVVYLFHWQLGEGMSAAAAEEPPPIPRFA